MLYIYLLNQLIKDHARKYIDIHFFFLFCRDDGWFEGKGVKRKKERGNGCNHKVAFITKSELEILDDGYKWRKYGKKSVKNSPHPR